MIGESGIYPMGSPKTREFTRSTLPPSDGAARKLRLGIASLALPSVVFGQVASVAFRDSYAVYGPDIYPAVTQVQYCKPYRVLVAYLNGTDMLFIDELGLSKNESTFQISRGVSIREFNFYEQSAEIQRITCRIANGEALQVSGRAHSFHSNRDFEFSITFEQGLGGYKYEADED
jgi:hypothetical protein